MAAIWINAKILQVLPVTVVHNARRFHENYFKTFT